MLPRASYINQQGTAVDIWYGRPVYQSRVNSGSEPWDSNELIMLGEASKQYPQIRASIVAAVKVVHELYRAYPRSSDRKVHGVHIVPILEKLMDELHDELPRENAVNRQRHEELMFIVARKLRFAHGEEPPGLTSGVSPRPEHHVYECQHVQRLLQRHVAPRHVDVRTHRLYTRDAVEAAKQRCLARE